MPDREEVISDIQDIFKYVPLWKVEKTLTDALVLLKEQEAVEPFRWPDSTNCNCGACKMPITQRYPFCPWCGKAVKWSG